MAPEYVLDLGRHALQIMLLMALPLLGVALIVGLVVSIIQAITQINETTLSFLPKLLALGGAIVIAGPWILALMTDFIRTVFGSIPGAVG